MNTHELVNETTYTGGLDPSCSQRLSTLTQLQRFINIKEINQLRNTPNNLT